MNEIAIESVLLRKYCISLSILKSSDKLIASSITKFIRNEVKNRKASVVVIGISGGIDSAATAALAVRALGHDKVFGLILPDSSVTPRVDIRHAIDLAKWLRIKYRNIELKEVKKQLLRDLPRDKLAGGNLLVRLRMIMLYYYAALRNGLVLGTGDKSEITLGYFTKYGDGAADLLPLADIYKTQVRSLARYLSIPDDIINKKSSARLWKGHTAEGELGLSYDEVDLILENLNNKSRIGEPDLKKKAAKLRQLIEKNKHKQEKPAVCKIK
jgi:NAD+ synthase